VIAPSEYREYSATVLFFVIPKIKDMEPALAFSSLARLNRVIAGSGLRDAVREKWIGSTISGLFVLIPDQVPTPAHALLPKLFKSLAQAGVPVRCGVTWGQILCFRDADEELNFIGRPINRVLSVSLRRHPAGYWSWPRNSSIPLRTQRSTLA
jgi:hypothetical protein